MKYAIPGFILLGIVYFIALKSFARAAEATGWTFGG
jgi:hypothetical protein